MADEIGYDGVTFLCRERLFLAEVVLLLGLSGSSGVSLGPSWVS